MTLALIDHIFVRIENEHLFKKQNILQAGVININLTDHYPVALSISNKNYVTNDKSKPVYVTKTNYNKLTELLERNNWEEILSENNVQNSYTKFIDKIKYYVEKCSKQ